jgi:hypothetical protein
MTPSFETPDEGGIDRNLKGSIRARAKPSPVQQAVARPAQFLRTATQAAALR